MTSIGNQLLDKLEKFCYIVREGSINGAAREMGLDQANLSKTLKSLERILGVKLCIRSIDGIQLTDHGILIYESAEEILEIYYRSIDRMATYPH